MSNFSNISKLIKHHRKKQRLSQTQLAEAMGDYHYQYVSNIERARCSVPVKSLDAVAHCLRIDKEIIITAMVEDYRNFLLYNE